jgi:hypothetical protein
LPPFGGGMSRFEHWIIAANLRNGSRIAESAASPAATAGIR